MTVGILLSAPVWNACWARQSAYLVWIIRPWRVRVIMLLYRECSEAQLCSNKTLFMKTHLQKLKMEISAFSEGYPLLCVFLHRRCNFLFIAVDDLLFCHFGNSPLENIFYKAQRAISEPRFTVNACWKKSRHFLKAFLVQDDPFWALQESGHLHIEGNWLSHILMSLGIKVMWSLGEKIQVSKENSLAAHPRENHWRHFWVC